MPLVTVKPDALIAMMLQLMHGMKPGHSTLGQTLWKESLKMQREFLAAMSSSRSDDVTKCVRVSVVIFLVWSILCIRCKMLQGCFKNVSSKF